MESLKLAKAGLKGKGKIIAWEVLFLGLGGAHV